MTKSNDKNDPAHLFSDHPELVLMKPTGRKNRLAYQQSKCEKVKNRRTYRTSIPALVLLFIYLLNPLKLYLPYVDYQVNYQYIKDFLCENKDKPNLNCEGKCFLSKALKGTQEKANDHQRVNPKHFFTDELSITSITVPIAHSSDIRSFTEYSFSSSTITPSHITPPPKA